MDSKGRYRIFEEDDWCVAAYLAEDDSVKVLYNGHYLEEALQAIIGHHGGIKIDYVNMMDEMVQERHERIIYRNQVIREDFDINV